MKKNIQFILCLMFVCNLAVNAQQNTIEDTIFSRENYIKLERKIPMRDGVLLYTVIYKPNNTTQKYPFLICRTPYSVAPYSADKIKVPVGPNQLLTKEGFIFVYQDVRGKYLSEGDFIANRPYVSNKKNRKVSDESSDAYDTIDWLIKNIDNNGKAGIWGISSPGFYATSSLIDSHPALKAVSPQAPVTDWFMGDDRHHNGAFMLMGSFSFLSSFGQKRESISTKGAGGFRKYGTPDGYQFYLSVGAIKNLNTLFLKNTNPLWNEMMENGTYNEYWKSRSPIPYLTKVKPAVLVVGGWFDQEDLYGPLKTFTAIEEGNQSSVSTLVMGPWYHGAWYRSDGESIGDIYFGSKTGEFYRSEIELPFFKRYLKDGADTQLPKAYIFETGSNVWKKYSAWPPIESKQENLYLQDNGRLSFDLPSSNVPSFVDYQSDPLKPVPYTSEIRIFRGNEYLVEDQRLFASRPDVITFQTEVLEEDVVLAGGITADLFVSTTGTDADFIVKLIDVYPNDAPNNSPNPKTKMGGYQLMVRGEVMRAKFRDSFSNPVAMIPNKITEVSFDMQDASHAFKKGHKIMVQIQSSWFPLVDRNPQTFTNIYTADEAAFQKANHKVYFDLDAPSHLKLHLISKKNN
jgi:putative CocE/NonD family hydrolase